MNGENDLNLPVFSREPEPVSERSLDEINLWIEENYRLFFDRESSDRKKKMLRVNTMFVL